MAAAQKRGLGRGLNALFEDEEEFAGIGGDSADAVASSNASVERKPQSVGIELLMQSPLQPRKLFQQESLDELAASIRVHGVIQPILVRPSRDEDGQYEIIAGERRWRAAQMAQLHEVPVVVREFSDVQAFEIALIENLQREDLNAVDEAMGYQRLMKEHDYTQEKLAETLGKSRPHIANMVRLLNLPDVVLVHLERGDISSGHARALITAKDPQNLVKQVMSKSLNVRQTEALVSDESGGVAKKKAASVKPKKDVDTLALEKDISDVLGMRVSIESKNGKTGKVAIDFKSLDQLDALLKKLAD